MSTTVPARSRAPARASALGCSIIVARILLITAVQGEAKIGVIHAALGEADAAFDWLTRAVQERSGWIAYLGVDPRLDEMRSGRRFQQVAGVASAGKGPVLRLTGEPPSRACTRVNGTDRGLVGRWLRRWPLNVRRPSAASDLDPNRPAARADPDHRSTAADGAIHGVLANRALDGAVHHHIP